MQTAKLFQNGRSQAVRLPKEFQFSGDDVLLFPKDKLWETFLHGLNSFTDDFMAQGRDQGEMQERKGL